MKTFKVIIMILSTLVNIVFAQENDTEIVQHILDINNNSEWNLDSLVEYTNGRISVLHLDNQNIVLKGITKIPSNIGKLVELRELTINNNSLTKVPKQIFNLTNLRL